MKGENGRESATYHNGFEMKGFPVASSGFLPRLLFTAAMYLATITDLCIFLLQSLGLIAKIRPAHIINYTPNHENHGINLDNPAIEYHPYFNPHLHGPADHPLLLRRSPFFHSAQASLPVLLYQSLPLHRDDDAQKYPDSQTKPHKLAVSTRSTTAYNKATAEASMPPYDQLQEHPPPAPVPLSSPRSCGHANAANSHDDHHLRQCALPSKLYQQVPAIESAISACGQQGAAAGSSYDSNAHLQRHAKCAVCLREFERGEEVRELPSCSHIFHKDCIDGWLLHNHHTCPLCRSSLLTLAVEVQERMGDRSGAL